MNIQKYEDDINKLTDEGRLLFWSMCLAENPAEKAKNKEALDKLGKLPDFRDDYQSWYSEALELIKQISPSRVEDFTGYYSHRGNRKELSYESYTIRDYLDGLVATRGLEKEKVVGTDAAIQKFKQQYEIVKALRRRFKSSLFDIKTLAQADLFDNELDTAVELNTNGYARAAGAVAGVVLESHLETVADRHGIKILKKNPTISDYNDALKNVGVIDIAEWRKIQFLGDIRNKCDHKKQADPTKEEVEELVSGTRRCTKTLF